MTVTYEWIVEFIDSDGEIIDVHHHDNYVAAVATKAAEPTSDFDRAHIGLVRDVGNDIEGLTDRAWAYIGDDGQLPEYFNCGETDDGPALSGHKVPQRFHREIAKGAP